MTRTLARKIATFPHPLKLSYEPVISPAEQRHINNAAAGILAAAFAEITTGRPTRNIGEPDPIQNYSAEAQTTFRAALYIHGFDIRQIGHVSES